MHRLIGINEVVIPFTTVLLVITYPLKNQASFTILTNGKGFSRKDLITEISRKYHQVYQEEEDSAKVKTLPQSKREHLINRNRTNGKYGIWGHDLSDLILCGVEVYKNRDGTIYLSLQVES